LLALALVLAAAAAGSVRDYRPLTGLATEAGTGPTLVVLRTFTQGGDAYDWLVDPGTLATRVVPASRLRIERRPFSEIRQVIADTPYGRALHDAAANEKALQGAGLDRVRPRRPGIDLTLDLCPSSHPLDRRLLSALVAALADEERPVPVAVAVTGVWMRQHSADLEWLVSLETRGALAITWVNHSFHHRVSPGRPLDSSFLLAPGTDVRTEVLDTEKAMLAAGLLPSAFFRFPGLVSRPGVFEKVVGLGLVPLGSDAWLAKTRGPATDGSIVLVHANGNEPLGVQRFLELLRTERERIRTGSWQILDLRESVVDTESPSPSR
jgi:hypothetical protein